MLTQQRKHLILNKLRDDGQIVAADLSSELGLSEDTIRRDLRALAAAGLLQRVHGGALPRSPALGSLAVRKDLQREGKLAIAKAAAAMVQAGQVVFVDGGTTCEKLAEQLPSSLRATVVTHSPSIAVALAHHSDVEVVLIGGQLYKHSMVAIGSDAQDAIRLVRADLYFMGASGISVAQGLCTGDLQEAAIKRTMMQQSGQTWVLASAEKINAASPYLVAPCSIATGLIVERDMSAQRALEFENAGLRVHRA